LKKIQRNKLFVQVTFQDLLEKLWLIFLFKVNCEVYIGPTEINSYNIAGIMRAARLLDKRGALRRVHAPICDPNKEGFDKFKEIYYKTSRFCKHLGADTIVMHPEGYWPEENLDIWKEIASSAEKDSVRVLLENHQEISAISIVKILSAVNSEYLKACFDVGHFYVFGEKDPKSILSHYPADSIDEVHLSDNMGDEDSHLPLGKGRIDFLRFLKAVDDISLKPCYTIEAKDVPGIVKGIWYLKKIGLL
jgi:sugar phosphate isomerase/epimerase